MKVVKAITERENYRKLMRAEKDAKKKAVYLREYRKARNRVKEPSELRKGEGTA